MASQKTYTVTEYRGNGRPDYAGRQWVEVRAPYGRLADKYFDDIYQAHHWVEANFPGATHIGTAGYAWLHDY